MQSDWRPMDMTNSRLILFLAVGPFAAAVIIGGVLAWLTGDLRVVGLVGLAAAIVGAGLTGYYENRVPH
jgi:hypothetical protein